MKIRNAAMLRQLAARVNSGIFGLTRSGQLAARLSAMNTRFGVLLLFAAGLATIFFADPAASSYKSASSNLTASAKPHGASENHRQKINHRVVRPERGSRLSAAGWAAGLTMPPLAVASESIATFASSDCQTPKTEWDLGQTVCATALGATGPRRIIWHAPNGLIAEVSDAFTSTENDLYTVPTGSDPFAQVGTWAVRVINNDGDAIASATFVIRDPNRATADLSLINSVETENIANGIISYTVTVFNLGPDTAQNIQVTDTAPASLSLASATSDSTAFTCSSATCTGATLAANAKATFTFVYNVPSGTPTDALINTASVSSTTGEPDSQRSDNNSISQITVGSGSGSGSSCTLICPANIVRPNDPGQAGANVTFAATPTGACGTVTYDPPSGFFPIGTTQVIASDGSTSCDFTVTINDAEGITITVNLLAPDTPPSPLTVECHTSFTDPGATASTGAGASVPVTTQVTCSDENGTFPCSFDINRPGAYNFVYSATNGTQTATATRIVNVVDTTPPVITVNGANPFIVECHTSFTDPGATANDSCAGSAAAIASGNVDVNTPGTYTITYEVSDPSGNEAVPVTRTVQVVDTTPPVITLVGANPMTVECHTSFTDPGAAATDGCRGSVAVTTSGSVNVNVPGAYTITYTATDGANPATLTRTVNVVDTTAPVITCPANVSVYLPLNSTATLMAVSYGVPTATDTCGTASVTSSPASGSVFPIGATTVTATATDSSGNTSSCTFTVTVLYNFRGFFSPIANPPAVNEVNAGRTIPVKFSLSGNKGLDIFAPGYPVSAAISCNFTGPVNNVEGTETPGGSNLSYSAGADEYHYNWKTESAWAGTCRQLMVKLKDGTVHVANFRFK